VGKEKDYFPKGKDAGTTELQCGFREKKMTLTITGKTKMPYMGKRRGREEVSVKRSVQKKLGCLVTRGGKKTDKKVEGGEIKRLLF